MATAEVIQKPAAEIDDLEWYSHRHAVNLFTSNDLQKREYPPAKWIVEGLLPEGLTILAGKPKIGKSWLALQIATSLSVGLKAFGHFDTKASRVLYLALEDSERRLRQRFDIIKALGSEKLVFSNSEWSRGVAGLKAIKDHITLPQFKDTKLIIIDTLGRLLPDIDLNDYGTSSPFFSGFQRLAQDHGMAIMAIHHTRKSGGDDFVDSVTGSNAWTGVADTVAVLTRGRGTADAFLQMTGRDIDEQDIALRLVRDEGWQYLGDAEEYRRGAAQQLIVEALRDATEPQSPKDVAALTGLSYSYAKTSLFRMEREGAVHKPARGMYTVKEV